MSKILFALTLLISSLVFAHEGHDHGPSAVQAPKGGVIRSLETVHLELVAKGPEVKIYPYDLQLKPMEVSKFPASVALALPKKKTAEAKLVEKGDHWLLQSDVKGVHRYTLEMTIKQGGHDDKIKWVVEPKK